MKIRKRFFDFCFTASLAAIPVFFWGALGTNFLADILWPPFRNVAVALAFAYVAMVVFVGGVLTLAGSNRISFS